MLLGSTLHEGLLAEVATV
jgi:hypothetical protein